MGFSGSFSLSSNTLAASASPLSFHRDIIDVKEKKKPIGEISGHAVFLPSEAPNKKSEGD